MTHSTQISPIKVRSLRSPRSFTSIVLSVLMMASVASGFIIGTQLPASAAITGVTVGSQTGAVTYAGGTVTYTVNITQDSTHAVILTGVSDASVPVSFGGSTGCQTGSSMNFTLSVTVPLGDTPGTYTHSLVASWTRYNSNSTCGGTGDDTGNSSGNGNGTLTIGKAAQAPLTVTSTTGSFGTPLTLTTSGCSGTGALTYGVANGSATGCVINSGAL